METAPCPYIRALRREQRTLEVMVGIYCRNHHRDAGCGHGDKTLCPDCRALLGYAAGRLERCPQWPAKPTCRRCTIHCYRPDMKVRVREVMRYAGPRMLWVRPIMALRHIWKEFGPRQ